MPHLSKYAEKLFLSRWKLNEDEKVIDIYEHVSHDGCDEFGPESELWDLYVITQRPPQDGHNRYVYYMFHTENWFRGGQVLYERELVYESHILLTFTQNEWLYEEEQPHDEDMMLFYDCEGLSSDYANRLSYLQKLESLKDLELLETLPADEAVRQLKLALANSLRPSVIEDMTISF